MLGEEHLDEAEFLVEQWRAARRSALYTLEELETGPEWRLAAHVDGLVVNGPVALQRLAWPQIDGGSDAHRVAAAALAMLDSGDFALLEALDDPDAPPAPDEDEDEQPLPEFVDEDYPTELLELETLPEPSPDDEDEDETDDAEEAAEEPAEPEPEPEASPWSDRAEGLALALALSVHPKIGDQLRSRATKAEGVSLALIYRACADRGLDLGKGLDRGLTHDDPLVLAHALRAAACSDRRRLLATVEHRLQHPSAMVRAAAFDVALQWGSRAAWELAMHQYKQPDGGPVTLWMACLGDDRHAEAMIRLLDDEDRRSDVLWALGFSGRVPAVEACLEYLDHDDETTRRLAGEAVAHILGLDLEDESLWEEESTEPPPEVAGDEPDQDEDDLEADLTETPEDELPLPNAEAIRALWEQHKGGFTKGHRYLLGKPVEREGPGWILPRMSCRRVDVVAREIVARSQGVGRWPGQCRARRHMQAASALSALGRQAGAIQGDRR